MGWTYLDIDRLPEPGDIVWCRYPLRERPGTPGPHARGVLVRGVGLHEENDTGIQYGSVSVSYSTGEFDSSHVGMDLIIRDRSRIIALGLHKPTRFALDTRNRLTLIWCKEFFAPSPYVVNRGIIAGRLNDDERASARACLARRGLLND